MKEETNYRALMAGAFDEIRRLKAKLAEVENIQNEPIAVIGMGCRFPGCPDVASFWETLYAGKDAVGDAPHNRWDNEALYDPNGAVGTLNTRHMALLDNIDEFDAPFFGIAPKEAVSLDPQQRLLLEVSWECLEDACIAPNSLVGSQTGIFMGLFESDYDRLGFYTGNFKEITAYSALGSLRSMAAGRLSYVLGLQGPSMEVDTACSTSLLTIHLGCMSLRQRESDLVLAGGVNLILLPDNSIALCRLKATSPSGRCRSFDDDADGYLRGEGCGVVALKRLSDAQEAGDRILALVKGSAVNHDGASSGLTVPNGRAQEKVIKAALRNSGHDPGDIQYVESHGTGTPLGDPIEIQALANTLCKDRSIENPLLVASVKTNIGHLESAAGAASFIKTVLALQHQTIPAHLHFKTPNRHIAWDTIPIKIPQSTMPWPSSPKGRLAGISTFGMSGSNVHVILAEAPDVPAEKASAPSRDCHLLALSAKTEIALMELVDSYREHLIRNPSLNLADLCYTANTGRAHFTHRMALVASSTQEMISLLAGQDTENAPTTLVGEVLENKSPVVFMFTGQGSQYIGMGQDLYQQEPVFKKALDACNDILEPILGQSLGHLLFPQEAGESPMDQTFYTQPLIVSFGYALAELWKQWGVKPDIVLGHSVGEYTAAIVAGVFSLEDGLKLIAHRARLMHALPEKGNMAVVFTDEATTARVIKPFSKTLSIAAINGPAQTVISGKKDSVEKALGVFQEEGFNTRRVNVSHAFHSMLMDPMLDDFTKLARNITFSPPKTIMISTLTGKQASHDLCQPNYWRDHVRQPVQFSKAMKTVRVMGGSRFIEVGPKPVLSAMGKSCFPKGEGIWLSSLKAGKSGLKQMTTTLGCLYTQGLEVNWKGYFGKVHPKKLALPTYPFQRSRYWNTPNSTVGPVEFLKQWPGRQLNLPLSEDIRFETIMTPQYPILLEHHKLFQTMVAPAASHLAYVLSCLAAIKRDHLIILENCIFSQVLSLLEDQKHHIQLILQSTGQNAYSFNQLSAPFQDGANLPNSWTSHTSGSAMLNFGNENSPKIDKERLQEECRTEKSRSYFYSKFSENYFWGESFRWVSQVWLGEGKALSLMKAPNLPNNGTDYELYPGLLDSCFQMLGACSSREDLSQPELEGQILVPFTVGSLIFHGRPQPGPIWCFAQLVTSTEQSRIGHLTLFQDDGKTIAEIRNFELRCVSEEKIKAQLSPKTDGDFYRIAWESIAPKLQPDQLEKSSLDQRENWLIFFNTEQEANQFSNASKPWGRRCIWVKPGLSWEVSTDAYTINPANPEHYQKLLHELTDHQIKGVVHAWGMDLKIEDPESIDIQLPNCESLLHLVNSLTGARWNHAPRLVTLTRNAAPTEGETPEIAQAPFWGLGGVIALEHPELNCLLLDLDGKEADITQAAALAGLSNGENRLALREGQCMAARLKQATASPNEIPIRSNGYYLITGGLGGLGLVMAQWLVSRGARRLILTRRSAPSEHAAEVIAKLEREGVHLKVVQADICDAYSLQSIFQSGVTDDLPLFGVLHIAGVLQDGLLKTQTWDSFSKVMAPKVKGAWTLHQLTQNQPLDFFICFSSIASSLGSSGQGNYASGNAFLDSLAHFRRAKGLPGLSINWGPWSSFGMAAKLVESAKRRLTDSGISFINPETGCKMMDQLTGHDGAQVTAFKVDWPRFLENQNLNSSLFFKNFISSEEPTVNHRRTIPDLLEKTQTPQRRAVLNELIRTLIAETLGINSKDAIKTNQNLFDLGIDSLMAMDFKNSLEEVADRPLRSTLVFDYPTVGKIESYIVEKVLPEFFESSSLQKPSNSKLQTGTVDDSEITNLSDEEAEARLLQELEKLDF